MRSWRSPPWRIVPRAKIAKRGELACRLRGAAPSLAKELQGAVGEGARGRKKRLGLWGQESASRASLLCCDVLAAFWLKCHVSKGRNRIS